MKQLKRMTRVEKKALSRLSGEHQSADQLGASDELMGSLVGRGFAVRYDVVGKPLYQITELGRKNQRP